jgi:bacteriorhodopsin
LLQSADHKAVCVYYLRYIDLSISSAIIVLMLGLISYSSLVNVAFYAITAILLYAAAAIASLITGNNRWIIFVYMIFTAIVLVRGLIWWFQ